MYTQHCKFFARTFSSRLRYARCMRLFVALFVALGMLALNMLPHISAKNLNAPTATFAGLSTDLVSWWSGEGNANDIVGSSQGTLLGEAEFASGRIGQAFSFDGVDDEISLVHASALNFGPDDSFTIAAWLKPSTSVLGTPRVAVSFTYVCSAEVISLSLLTNGKIDFGLRDNNGISVDAVSPNSILDGQWHHVTSVRDAGSHNVTLYIDGESVASLADTTTGTFTRGDAQDSIGSIPVACPTDRYFWDGQIDEIQVFNRALSSPEVSAIANPGRSFLPIIIR
jgi:hypothetical protein